MKWSSCFIGIFLALVSVCCRVKSSCSKGCDVALASYYVWQGANLTFISQALDSQVSDIARYNQDWNLSPDSVRYGFRINVPFSCQCIGGSFLGHIFNYKVQAGDTYTTVAQTCYSNLTTASWLQSFNFYDPNQIPDNVTLNVTVNCSCVEDTVSKDYDLFITYPLRPEDSLESIYTERHLDPHLLESYNPGVNFNLGSGLVYIPYKVPPPPPPPTPPSPQTAVTAPPLPSTTTARASNGKKSNMKKIAVIVVVSTISMMLIVCVLFVRSKRNKYQRQTVEGEATEEISTVESLQCSLSMIRDATDDFSNARKLGQGGFGAVYLGRLYNGQQIAVKRLSRNSCQGEEEFKNEVMLLARLQHKNLVRLVGFCLEGNERLLIYEFVRNSSLDKFIFDPNKQAHLDWDRRYKIIMGVARGLLYLHEDSRLRIIHRDLKASNILLDSNMHPKISDFGLAKLLELDQTQAQTNRIVGTYGYMAPEYAMQGSFSVKSDVYSFGVLVLEIVSGQRNNIFQVGDNMVIFMSHVWKNWRQGTITNIIDPSITSASSNEISRCIHIGLLCVQGIAANRPTMASIVHMLNSHSVTLHVPLQPAFLHQRDTKSNLSTMWDYESRAEVDKGKDKSNQFSRNEASFTEPFAR